MVSFVDLLKDFNIKNFEFSSSATVNVTKADEGKPLWEEYCVHEYHEYEEDGNRKAQQPGVLGLTSPYGKTKWM